MKFCLPFIAGIIIGWHFPFTFMVLRSGLLLECLLLFATLFMKLIRKEFYSTLLLFGVILLAGILKIHVDARYISFDNVANFVTADREVQLIGVISDEPHRTTGSYRFVIDSKRISLTGRSFDVTDRKSVV